MSKYPAKKYFSIEEIAQKLNCTREHVLEWVGGGHLAAAVYNPIVEQWYEVSPDAMKHAIWTKSNSVKLIRFKGDHVTNDNTESVPIERVLITAEELERFENAHNQIDSSFREEHNFSRVWLQEELYEFNEKQAAVIEYIYKQHLKGIPHVHQNEIKSKSTKALVDDRIDRTFQHGKKHQFHKAWGKLLISLGNADYRLNIFKLSK